MSSKINVAICGGGIGGVACAIALAKLPNLNVNIYEAAHQFGEVGAGLGIGPNAIRALRMIDPETSAVIQKHRTFNTDPTWAQDHVFGEMRLANSGPRANEVLVRVKDKDDVGINFMHRMDLLNYLTDSIDSKTAHFGKRLVSVEDDGTEHNGITLRFKDGTSTKCDVLIGADGIHSPTRAFVIGKDHPANSPQFTGNVAYRGVCPMDKARALLGPQIAENLHFWAGDGGFLVHFPVNEGKALNIAAFEAGVKEWTEEKWERPEKLETVAAKFENFSDEARKIVSLVGAEHDPLAWSIWDLQHVPHFNKGRVAIMGDAAHACTPFNGQGAGQAIEDTLVLAHVLSLAKSPADVPAAFKAYDAVRRIRTQDNVRSSREAGKIMSLSFGGVGANSEVLQEIYEYRWKWIWDVDLIGQNVRAEIAMKEELEREKAVK